MTEESTFRGKTADFVYFLFYGIALILVLAILTAARVSFLSSSLNFMLIYVWARRNPDVRMNFMGVFNFTAPYLPWAFLGFSVIMNNDWPVADLIGMSVGHVYYFLQDIYPKIPGTGGRKLLDTPKWIRRLGGEVFEEDFIPVEEEVVEDQAAAQEPPPQDGNNANVDQVPEAGPGGYAWRGQGHLLNEARRRPGGADAPGVGNGE